MAKIIRIAGIFTRLYDWFRDQRELTEEINRLRKRNKSLEEATDVACKQSREAIVILKEKHAVCLAERDRVIVELRTQVAHLNDLLFECRGKSDAAERSQE